MGVAQAAIPTGNLTTNPSWEGNTAGWSSYQGTITRTALVGAPDGSYVARITRTTGTSYSVDDGPDTVVSSVAGRVYAASASVRMVAGSRPIALMMRERNPAGTIVGSATSGLITVGTSFVTLNTSLKAGYAGNTIDMYVYQSAAVEGDAMYVDLLTMLPDTILWTADAERTADLQWASSSCEFQAVTPPLIGNRIQRSTTRHQGGFAYRFEMLAGDTDPWGAHRCELGQGMPHRSGDEWRWFREGEERWLAMQYFFPTDWPSTALWQTVFQIKPTQPGGGGPNLGIDAQNNSLRFSGNDNVWGSTAGAYRNDATFPLPRGKWIKLTWHMYFSANASQGWYEVFGDLGDGAGMRTLVPRTTRATLKYYNNDTSNPDPGHLRVGIYREPRLTQTASVYVDGVTVATTRQSAEAVAYGPVTGSCLNNLLGRSCSPPPRPPPPPPPPAGPSASFAGSPTSVRVSKTGRFSYPFVATPAASGKITFTSTKRVKVGSKKRKLSFAKAFTAPASGKVLVKLKLSPKNLKALKHAKHLRFTVTVSLAAKTFTTKVTLKAPKKT